MQNRSGAESGEHDRKIGTADGFGGKSVPETVPCGGRTERGEEPQASGDAEHLRNGKIEQPELLVVEFHVAAEDELEQVGERDDIPRDQNGEIGQCAEHRDIDERQTGVGQKLPYPARRTGQFSEKIFQKFAEHTDPPFGTGFVIGESIVPQSGESVKKRIL